ncbi:hypothetical protein BDN72DRAFT_835203 [Pluteus cervinus]|uniref:Uncharacterized protein n=1 Tax=Pluteus cervinus TaxID=181527 RepID=A0ACD3B6C6_9AGAR|nr:hypothetical protein BDN72DRAFT_835203 [Pluteus cervinus]
MWALLQALIAFHTLNSMLKFMTTTLRLPFKISFYALEGAVLLLLVLFGVDFVQSLVWVACIVKVGHKLVRYPAGVGADNGGVAFSMELDQIALWGAALGVSIAFLLSCSEISTFVTESPEEEYLLLIVGSWAMLACVLVHHRQTLLEEIKTGPLASGAQVIVGFFNGGPVEDVTFRGSGGENETKNQSEHTPVVCEAPSYAGPENGSNATNGGSRRAGAVGSNLALQNAGDPHVVVDSRSHEQVDGISVTTWREDVRDAEIEDFDFDEGNSSTSSSESEPRSPYSKNRFGDAERTVEGTSASLGESELLLDLEKSFEEVLLATKMKDTVGEAPMIGAWPRDPASTLVESN